MRVVVVGAGKMGLPLACQFARRGASVIACDIKRDVVEAINRGICPIDEAGVPELLSEMVARGRLTATTETSSAVPSADVIVVIVPVTLTREFRPDTAAIESASREIAKGLKKGMLVSYETTLPVGGSRKLAAILEESGLEAGVDFDFVFSPERVKSRFVLRCLTENPKVVGGINSKSAERGASFYAQYLGAPVRNVRTLEAAELVKLAGMTYRDVNIAVSNELARYAEHVGVDFDLILRAANEDGEAALLLPGIGVGGHCTPVYPHFVIQDSHERGIETRLTKLARDINDQQPIHVLERVERICGSLKRRRVVILGLGFRPQVKEHICSPAFQLRDELARCGASVYLHDPLYSDAEIRAHNFEPISLADLGLAEVLILNTAHDIYQTLDFAWLAAGGLKVVVDGRNLWSPDQVCQAGLLYLGVGRVPQGSSTNSDGSMSRLSVEAGVKE